MSSTYYILRRLHPNADPTDIISDIYKANTNVILDNQFETKALTLIADIKDLLIPLEREASGSDISARLEQLKNTRDKELQEHRSLLTQTTEEKIPKNTIYNQAKKLNAREMKLLEEFKNLKETAHTKKNILVNTRPLEPQ